MSVSEYSMSIDEYSMSIDEYSMSIDEFFMSIYEYAMHIYEYFRKKVKILWRQNKWVFPSISGGLVSIDGSITNIYEYFR
jgi:hypothetical protein